MNHRDYNAHQAWADPRSRQPAPNSERRERKTAHWPAFAVFVVIVLLFGDTIRATIAQAVL